MRKRSAIDVDAGSSLGLELPANVITIGEDKPIAFAVPEEKEADGDAKRFKGMRKSGKVWKTTQKEP